jgi:hypothetical protein
MKTKIAALMLAACLSQSVCVGSKVLLLPALPDAKVPVMDGTLQDPLWQQAAALDLGETVMQLRPAVAGSATTLRMLVGNGNLYLGFECRFPPEYLPQSRMREHDAPVFEDESIEFFIAPDGRPGEGGYYHFAVNSRGSMTERRNFDPAWNAEWQGAVKVGEDRWTATLTVPLAALVDGGPGGHYWRINTCRNIYDGRGAFVQGMTLARPGYYHPGIPLLVGPVGAPELLSAVNAALAEMEGVFRPHLSGAIKRQYDRLIGYRKELEAADAAVPVEKAAVILETALDNAGRLEDMIIWNYMFE